MLRCGTSSPKCSLRRHFPDASLRERVSRTGADDQARQFWRAPMHDVRPKLTKCFPGVFHDRSPEEVDGRGRRREEAQKPLRFRGPGVAGGGLGRPADFFWQLDASAVMSTKRGKETTNGGCSRKIDQMLFCRFSRALAA